MDSTPGTDREHPPLARLDARPDARPALAAWLREHGTLTAAAAAHPDAEALAGRGRVHVVPAPVGDGRWVVRHYHRGGAVASLLGDRYLRLGTRRPFRELRVGRALESRGIPTPAHVGAAVYPSGPWYRGDLVTRYVPQSRDLAAVLFPGRSLGERAEAQRPARSGVAWAADPESAMRAAGALFRRLHEGGVVHPDLNLKNVLVAGTGEALEALVLDLDRAGLRDEVGDRARRRMIDRFWRSARKWEAATGMALEPGLRAAFEAGYG